MLTPQNHTIFINLFDILMSCIFTLLKPGVHGDHVLFVGRLSIGKPHVFAKHGTTKVENRQIIHQQFPASSNF